MIMRTEMRRNTCTTEHLHAGNWTGVSIVKTLEKWH